MLYNIWVQVDDNVYLKEIVAPNPWEAMRKLKNNEKVIALKQDPSSENKDKGSCYGCLGCRWQHECQTWQERNNK